MTLATALDTYKTAEQNFLAAERALHQQIETVNRRIHDTDRDSKDRIAVLEKICYNNPAERLRRLEDEISTFTTPATIAWMNYYSGHTGVRARDRHVIEKEIAAVKDEMRYCPPTPAETELYMLRKNLGCAYTDEISALKVLANHCESAIIGYDAAAGDLETAIAAERDKLSKLEKDTVKGDTAELVRRTHSKISDCGNYKTRVE